jgi:hypothetical protein
VHQRKKKEKVMREMEMMQRQIAELRAAKAELEAQLQAEADKPKSKKSKRDFVFTPYQATKLMNEERAKLGLKEVNSPMLYIYARKGAFAIFEGADGRKEVERESFVKWMQEHNAKQASGKKTS